MKEKMTNEELVKNSNQPQNEDSKNFIIRIWENEDCRGQGLIPIEIYPHHKKMIKKSPFQDLFGDEPLVNYSEDFNMKTIEEIQKYVIKIYDGYIKEPKGSIEIDEVDEKDEWVRTLYHISEDSNHTLEKV